RCAGDLVHQRNRDTEPREIDALQIVAGGFTCGDGEMVAVVKVKVDEFVLVLLPAVRAEDSTEGPHREACGALQRPPSAFERSATAVRSRKRRDSAAKRTAVVGSGCGAADGHDAGVSQRFSVRLKNSLRDELSIRWIAPDDGQYPVARRRRAKQERASFAGKQCRTAAFDLLEEGGKCGTQPVPIAIKRTGQRSAADCQAVGDFSLEAEHGGVERQQLPRRLVRQCQPLC